MPEFIRDLHLFADSREIAQGCRISLTAQDTLILRPALHHLEIRNLSDSSAALLSGAKFLEVQSGNALLAFGEIAEVYSHFTSGASVTSIIFSPGLSLWQSSVSVTLPAGMKVSETMRHLLTSSGAGISLAAYAADDLSLPRPQAFFGRTCDALSMMAETVKADVFLSSAGVCVSGRSTREVTAVLPESTLLSAPVLAGNRWILTVGMSCWPLGSLLAFSWRGISHTGRLISSLIQADNVSGPWKAELELTQID